MRPEHYQGVGAADAPAELARRRSQPRVYENRPMIPAITTAPSRPSATVSEQPQAAPLEPRESHPAGVAESDVLELSEASTAPNREELVQRVRAELAAGTYLSDDKVQTAVERLYEALFGRQ